MRVANERKQMSSYAEDMINCDWKVMSAQLLEQWQKLTKTELEETRHNRHAIAQLIEEKYGVDSVLTENYLKNLERTLPIFH